MDLNFDVVHTIVWSAIISGGFCSLILVLWCIVQSDEEESDGAYYDLGRGSEMDLQTDESHERKVVRQAMDKSMTAGKMLNPPYRMTHIGPNMTRPSTPAKMNRDVDLREKKGSKGKDAFGGEGQ